MKTLRARYEYHCDHCGATFHFVDTTKGEVTRVTRGHNCPICGNPVKLDEGYMCTKCGKTDLCGNCSQMLSKKIVCIECLRNEEVDCFMCGKHYGYKCTVCETRACPKHTGIFAIESGKAHPSSVEEAFFSLECPKCDGCICIDCFTEKSSLLGGKTYFCKKCGTQLTKIDSIFP